MQTTSETYFAEATPTALPIKLAQLKKSVIRRLSGEFDGRLPLALIRRAVDEADELARSTGFPHLVLPLLAEETVRRVSYAAFNDDITAESTLAVA